MALAYHDPKRPNVVTRSDGSIISRRMAVSAGYVILSHPMSGATHSTSQARGAQATPSLSQADEDRLVLTGVTRAFRSAVMQLPEAACRPAAAAKLADMETFTAAQVGANGFTIGPQLDRAQSFLRGLPPEMLPDDEQAERSATYDAGMRRRVEVAMATLPSTGPSNRIRSKLGRVLMSANEGRPIRAALASYGFDPEAYAPRNHPEN